MEVSGGDAGTILTKASHTVATTVMSLFVGSYCEGSLQERQQKLAFFLHVVLHQDLRILLVHQLYTYFSTHFKHVNFCLLGPLFWFFFFGQILAREFKRYFIVSGWPLTELVIFGLDAKLIMHGPPGCERFWHQIRVQSPSWRSPQFFCRST